MDVEMAVMKADDSGEHWVAALDCCLDARKAVYLDVKRADTTDARWVWQQAGLMGDWRADRLAVLRDALPAVCLEN